MAEATNFKFGMQLDLPGEVPKKYKIIRQTGHDLRHTAEI